MTVYPNSLVAGDIDRVSRSAGSRRYRLWLGVTSSFAALVIASPVLAQTAWTGATNTDFSTPTNWTGGTPTPASGGVNVTTATVNAPTLNGGGGADIFNLDNNTLTITNNGALTANSGVNILSPTATLNNSGQVTAPSGNIINGGTINNQTTGSFTSIGGNFTNNSGGVVNNSGTISGYISFNNNLGGSVDNTSSGTLTAAYGVFFNGGTITNAGTLQSLAGPQKTSTGLINNLSTGTITNNSGKVIAGYGLTNSGTINNNGSGLVQVVQYGLNNYGTINNTAKAMVQALNGDVTNGTNGVITNDGVVIGSTGVTNSSGSLIANNSTGFVTAASGNVTNTGTITNAGVVQALAGTFTNNATGLVTNNSGFIYGQTGVVNSATATINNNGTGLVQAITGNVTNAGAILNQGVVQAYKGLFVNQATGNVTNTPTGKIFGQTGISNLGTIANNGSGLVQAVNGDMTNTGTITSFGEVSAQTGNIVNQAKGTIVSSGILLAKTISNAATGLLTSTGDITAQTSLTNSGTTNIAGTLETPLVSNSGLFSVTGPLAGLTTTFTNNAAGTVALAGNFTGVGAFNNFGTLSSTGNQSLEAAAFTNQSTGVISTVNNKVGQTLTIAGNYAGIAGSKIVLDVDLSKASSLTPLSDQLAVTGIATGTSAISLNAINTGRAYFTTPITLLKIGGGSTLAISNLGLATSSGVFNYYIKQSTENSGIYQVVSQFNPAPLSGVVTAMRSVANSMETSFLQPASSLINQPERCRPNSMIGNPFIKVGGGSLNEKSSSNGDIVGGNNNATGTNRASNSFVGFEAGLGGGLCNIQNTGWNFNLALLGGSFNASNTTTSSQANMVAGAPAIASNTKSNVSVPFVGVSGIITNGGFTLDLGVRKDFYDAKLSSTNAVSGSNAFIIAPDTKLKGGNLAFTASAAYKFVIGNVWFVEPQIGITKSSLKLGNLQLATAATDSMAFTKSASLLAHAGIKIGAEYRVGERFLISPFGQFAIWNEMANPDTAQATLGSAAQVFNVQADRVGSFGQAALGAQFRLQNAPLVGFVRGDMVYGSKINAQSLNAGLKMQF